MDNFNLKNWQICPFDLLIDQVAIDSRAITSKNALFVALEGQRVDGHTFIPNAVMKGAKVIIAKKGKKVPPLSEHVKVIFVDHPLHALQEIAAAYRKQKKAKVIVVGGSNGKTMVKDLLHEMLATHFNTISSPESFNSQLGVPLSLLTIKDTHEVALIEAAFSKIGESSRLSSTICPDFGVITHIGKKHKLTLGSNAVILSEMTNLLSSIENKKNIIAPEELYPGLICWKTKDSLTPHVEWESGSFGGERKYKIAFPDETEFHHFATSSFSYFIDLVTIAVKTAWMMQVPKENICKVLQNYEPEPMRSEVFKTPSGATIVNDSYCSHISSLDRSYKYFDNSGKKIFLFGGLRHSKTPEITALKAPVDELIFSEEPNYKSALLSLAKRLKTDDTLLIRGPKRLSFEKIAEAFTGSINNNTLYINLSNVADNIAKLKAKALTSTRMMVMVKALAYGTDDIRMSKFLATCGVDILGVSYIDEAVALKKAGVQQNIFVLNAAPYEANKLLTHGFEVGVSDQAMIDTLEKTAKERGARCKVHLHVNTGMGRFGCSVDEALHLAKAIEASSHLTLEGIMTHFAAADDPSQDEFTKGQYAKLLEAIHTIEKAGIHLKWKSAQNSAGLIRFDFPEMNMVRLGLAVYGLYPSLSSVSAIDLEPAISLHSRIVSISLCKKGESISYGRKFVADKDIKVAVLPIGYYDGLHRNYSNKVFVLIRGHKAPFVGNICMDYMMIDVSGVPHVEVGDPVLIFGKDDYGYSVLPEEFAEGGNSITHELITCLGPRIARVFCFEEKGS